MTEGRFKVTDVRPLQSGLNREEALRCLATGVLHPMGFLLSPAVGAIVMSASTVIVAINARFLRAQSL